MNKFGERLGKLRQEHGLTQKELANLFHISNTTISSYETGARIPNLVFLEEISKFYNVSSDYIMGLSDNPLSPDIWGATFINNVSYRSVIEKLQKLSPERKRTALALIDDLHFCSIIQERALSIDAEKTDAE